MYYSIPYLVSSFVAYLDLLDAGNISLLELLLVSWYTSPISSRCINEFKFFKEHIPLWDLVWINLDLPLVIILYTSSVASLQAKFNGFLTGERVYMFFLSVLFPSHVSYISITMLDDGQFW